MLRRIGWFPLVLALGCFGAAACDDTNSTTTSTGGSTTGGTTTGAGSTTGAATTTGGSTTGAATTGGTTTGAATTGGATTGGATTGGATTGGATTGGTTGGGGPMLNGDGGCWLNAQTAAQIIDSCPTMDITVFDKNPSMPLLNSNGSRPPLP